MSLGGHRVERLSLTRVLALAICSVGLAACAGRVIPSPVPLLPTPTSLPSPTRPATAVPTITPSPTATPMPTPEPTVFLPPRIQRVFQIPGPTEAGRAPVALQILGQDLYVANWATDNVSIVRHGTVQKVISVGSEPTALAADVTRGRVYVLNETDATVSVLEEGQQIALWSLPAPCSYLLLAGEELWAAGMFSDELYVLSSRDGTLLRRISLAVGGIRAMASIPEDEGVLVLGMDGLEVLDEARDERVMQLAMSHAQAMAVSSDGSRVFVAGFDAVAGEGYLAAFDLATQQLVWRVQLGQSVNWITLAPDGKLLYLLAEQANRLMVWSANGEGPLGEMTLGPAPVVAHVDTQTGQLYVANRRGDSIVVVDPETLSVVDRIPLAILVGDLVVDTEGGRLYVAYSNADQVLVFEGDRLSAVWDVDPCPVAMAVIPGSGKLAVLSGLLAHVGIYDLEGRLQSVYPVGEAPSEVSVSPQGEQLYAGGTLIDLSSETWESFEVTSELGTREFPRKLIWDTGRDLAYAVALNGIPGSNGGYIVYRVNGGTKPMLNRVGVVDLIYDRARDRFYVTYSRMGHHSLLVQDVAEGAVVREIELGGYPVAMALDAAYDHLWLALAPSPPDDAARTMLVAYDLEQLREVHRERVRANLRTAAVDALRGVIYWAAEDSGRIYALQDGPVVVR